MDSVIISPPYPAARLELHLRQIRLVTILPGRYIDSIICELSTASVDDLPDYYSLSYVWGDQKDLRHILLNGFSFDITRNLEAALRRLRHPIEPRLFWIDMLCINQGSAEERTHQVNLMQFIYSKATNVFHWFGDYVETTMQKGSLSAQVNETQEYLSHLEAVRAFSFIEKLATDQHLDYFPKGVNEEVLALAKLVKSSWWSRVWTIQEVILPPKVTIVVGWLQLPWTTLAGAIHNLMKHQSLGCCSVLKRPWPSLLTFYRIAYQVDWFDWFRSDFSEERRHLNLLDLLQAFRSRSSTDPRDKIFSLLGLVMRNPKYEGIRANYTLSAQTVYEEVFICLLQKEGDLNLLVRPTESRRKLGLPTWIPDWTADVDDTTTDLDMRVWTGVRLYNASCSTRANVRWDRLPKTLSAKGFLWDEVVAVLGDSQDKTWPLVQGIEGDLDMLRKELSDSYIAGGDLAHAFRRLIRMDQVLESPGHPHSSAVRRAAIEDYWNYSDNSRLDYRSAFQLFVSKRGYIGLGPRNMRVGDTVHVFLGATVSFVLRRVEQIAVSFQSARYEYIGNCYVQGIMNGEALYGVDLDRLDWFDMV